MVKWLAGISAAVIAGVFVFLLTEKYELLTPLEISQLSARSGRGYVDKDNLRSGAKVYTDRNYLYSLVPTELEGKTYIKTANADKFSTGDDFLSFSINKPATIYVGYDIRYKTRPSWLSQYIETGLLLKLETAAQDLALGLYKREFPKGMVVLGGNITDTEKANNGMYTVIIDK